MTILNIDQYALFIVFVSMLCDYHNDGSTTSKNKTYDDNLNTRELYSLKSTDLKAFMR